MSQSGLPLSLPADREWNGAEGFGTGNVDELEAAMGRSTVSRRQFLMYGAGLGAAAALPWAAVDSAVAAARSVSRPLARAASAPLKGTQLGKFLSPLPVPGAGIVVATPAAPNQYSFTQTEISRQLHPALPSTPIWAYDDGSGLSDQAGSFGMAVVAQRGTPLDVTFTSALPSTYPSWLPVDTRLTPMGDAVRTMTHLHGGFVAAESDGNPAITPNGFGPGEPESVHYPNDQAATLSWFHDHGLGTTRLNVFAGLAAAYLLRDGNDTGAEPNPIGLPGGAYEVPLVIQDRQFATDGSFFYPTSHIPGVTWIGEYFGDTMLVNGKVWPYLDVEPRLYRFRILNGCNARILALNIGVPIWQIGAEGGMFDQPVPMGQLTLAPAERADIVADFSGFAGATLNVTNRRPRRPVVTPAQNLAAVMQFRVGTTVTQPGPASIPTSLPGVKADLGSPVTTRFISLNEVGTDTADWQLNMNGTPFMGATASETPTAGTIEDWVFVNVTGDTHPIHVHLVTFQVIGRTPFNAEAYEDAFEGPEGVPGGIDPSSFATGPMKPALPEERGFKDTVKANPGEYTTIRAKFDLPAGVVAPQTYVHHCHIIEHEDNEMMLPFTVVP